ncbi:MAG TPA: AAA family ATPase [Polyangiaceae bacterium]|nr:AAA family ATPase [Polyangiaceae bacterium]
MPADIAEFTWDEFVDELAELANRPTGAPEDASAEEQKRCMLAWAPHALREKTTRAKANVEAVTLLALDVDQGDPDEVIAALERHGWAGFLYATPSDTPVARRFRVVSPIVSPIAPEDCRATRIAFAEALGLEPGSGVEETGDPSRLLFAGRLHDTPPRATYRVAGEPLDVATLPAPTLAWGAPNAPTPPAAPLGAAPANGAGIAGLIGDWRAYAGRKWVLCGAIGGVMRRNGCTRGQCADELQAWLLAGERSVDVDAGVSWALGAWDKAAEDVSGVEVLAELVGADRAARIEAAAFASSYMGRWSSRRQANDATAPLVNDDRAGRGTPVTGGGDSDPLAILGDDRDFDSACERLDWLIEGFQIAPGKVTLLTGYAGSSKTPTAALIAVCVAAGLPCMGKATRQTCVLYLAAEGGRNARKKMVCIGRALNVDVRRLRAEGRLTVLDARALDDERIAALERVIASKGYGLVIVDTVTSALRSANVGRNDEAYARALFDLGEISERTRCVVLGLAHDNKSGTGNGLRGVSGTSAITEAAQTVIRLEPSAADHKLIQVSCERGVDERFDPFGIRWVDVPTSVGAAVSAGGLTPLRCELDDAALFDGRGANRANAVRAAEKLDSMRRAAPRVLDAVAKRAVTRDEIQTTAGITGRALGELVARLIAGGAIIVERKYHSLTPAWSRWPTPALQTKALEIAERGDL